MKFISIRDGVDVQKFIDFGKLVIKASEIVSIEKTTEGYQIDTKTAGQYTTVNDKLLEELDECIKQEAEEEERLITNKPNFLIPSNVISAPHANENLIRLDMSKPNVDENLIKLTEPDSFISEEPPPSLAKSEKQTARFYRRTARIFIDNLDLNSATGSLPFTPIVNKQSIVITDIQGLELGRSIGSDGQITGAHVSGVVSGKGKYRLVFKDFRYPNAQISYDTIKNVKSL